MKNESKTERQLVQELIELRRQVAEMEKIEAERKRTEEALRESEKRYREVVESAPEIIHTTDIQGNFTFANSAFLKATATSLEEFKKLNYLDIIHPDHRQRLAEIYINQFRERNATIYVEFPILSRSGEVIWLGQNSSLMMEGKKVVGFHSVARDITERKRAEEALRESEERYRTIFEQSRDAIYISTRSGKFIDVNQSMVNLFGYTREEMLELDISMVYVDAEGRRKFQQKIEQEGALKDYEVKFFRKDGKEIDCLLTATVRYAKDGSILGYQGIVHDITPRKRAEEALRKSEAEARRLAQENEVIAEIGRIISSTLNIEEVYERFAEEVRKLIPFDRVAVNIINPDGQTFTIPYFLGLQVPGWEIGRVNPLTGAATEEVFRTGSSLLIQGRSQEEITGGFPSLSLNFKAGLRSFILVPLISESKVIGVLYIQSARENAYTEKDLGLAERVGTRIAGAIANARLYMERMEAEEAARRSEEEAKRLAQENVTVAEIGRIISSTLEIEKTYEFFAVEVRKIIPFDRIAINIIYPEKDSYVTAYIEGKDIAGFRPGNILPLAGSLTKEVVRTRSSMLIDRDEVTSRFPHLLPFFHAGFRSFITVPLISKDQVIGVLHIFSVNSKAYMEADKNLAERIGNQIAGAIANAQLFAERKRIEEEREKLVRDLQKALSEVKTLKGIFPICAPCKKIRDDKGYWNQVEVYIRDRSEAEFSHGICPDCKEKLYGDFLKEGDIKI